MTKCQRCGNYLIKDRIGGGEYSAKDATVEVHADRIVRVRCNKCKDAVIWHAVAYLKPPNDEKHLTNESE